MGGRREDYAQPISDSYLYAALGRAEAAESARDALLTDPLFTLMVDTSFIDTDETITIPMWRWHVLTCHSTRLRELIAKHRPVSVPAQNGES